MDNHSLLLHWTALIALLVTGCGAPLSTPTLAPTETSTPTPMNTPTSTPTATPTDTPTATPTPTWTPTPTSTPTSTPTPTRTPTSTPKPIVYDGEWWGSTSDGRPIYFKVVNNAVTVLSVELGFGCNAKITLNLNTPQRINVGKVSVTSKGGTSSLVLAGTFTSNTAASGTLEASLSMSECSGSANVKWNAMKQ